MPISIKYLRHGIIRTGGARHEEFLLSSLGQSLEKKGIPHSAEQKIANSIFKAWANFRLIIWGIKESNADVNIVVGRLALSSLLKNFAGRSKTLIVLHNFDEEDGKSALLRYYYKVLFYFLAKTGSGKAAIIAVSPYFQKYFQNRFPRLNVFLFPNLFNTQMYIAYRQGKRDKLKILLGQYSSKMDNSVYMLAEKLSQAGYYCYFCTLRADEVAKHPSYHVKKFDFEEYLAEMASSYCSLSLSGVNEGWPRMVHESILAGTPVIGYDKGGLGDLLKESGSYIAKNAEEAYGLITTRELSVNCSDEFIKKYDISTADAWLKPILNYILKTAND